jgi:hypothetical protein
MTHHRVVVDAEDDLERDTAGQLTGNLATTVCPPARTVFSEQYQRFQSGDPVFTARVKQHEADAKEAEGLLKDSVKMKRCAEKKRGADLEADRLEAEIKVRRKYAARCRELADAAQMEDERRGRARVMNHDECPQAIQFGGGKGSCRARVAHVPGERPVQATSENRCAPAPLSPLSVSCTLCCWSSDDTCSPVNMSSITCSHVKV